MGGRIQGENRLQDEGDCKETMGRVATTTKGSASRNKDIESAKSCCADGYKAKERLTGAGCKWDNGGLA